MHTSGITTHKRNPAIIISLTSIPTRLKKLHLTLETLLCQSIKPDFLILWLGSNITTLPDSIKNLESRGLQVFYRKDIGSYKKEIYVLREFPDALLVTADDDILYPKNWLKELYEEHLRNPKCIPCHNGNMINFDTDGNLARYRSWTPGRGNSSLLLCPFTGTGALYPIGSLHADVCNEDLFLKLCPNNDDIWMKFMTLLNHIPCKMINKNAKSLFEVIGSQTESLNKTNTRIDEFIRNLAKYYGINERYFK